MYHTHSQKEIGDALGLPRRSIGKICKSMGLSRTVSEAASLKIKSPLDSTETIKKVRELRPTKTLHEMAEIFETSVSALERLCVKYNIKKPKNYSKLQSEKMKSAWTEEKRVAVKEKYKQRMNISQTVLERLSIHTDDIFMLYDSGLSMAEVAKKYDTTVGYISTLFKRNGKEQRPISETYSKLRFKNAIRKTVKTKWGTFNLQSEQEQKFVESVPETSTLEYEPTTFRVGNRSYTPDFLVDNKYVEIKPSKAACVVGAERSTFIKQKLIAAKNGVEISTWYKGNYYDHPEIEDLDIYYALDWRLFFESPQTLCDWLLNHGFRPLKWSTYQLWNAFYKDVPDDKLLNANYPHVRLVNLIRNFSEHYWYSHRDGFLPVTKAFELGNTSVLKDAAEMLWNKKDCNIYSLVTIINKEYKDFMMPSVFKPWVAKHVYNKHLSENSTIYDPCMGWGGRLVGTIDKNITYIGSDLNKNSVNSVTDLNGFLCSRVSKSNQFFQADASKVTREQLPEKIDAIFTSPPYDDTERYHGLEKQCTDTSQIYRNLFGLGIRKVIFNIPWRHSDNVKKIATDCGYKLIDTMEMKTSAPIRRSKMSEPIHVFVK
jgi:hypothetical protein